MLLILMSLACAPRYVNMDVELPAGEPDPRSTYSASTTTWKLGVGRVKMGSFTSNTDALTCTVEGRLITAEVTVPGSEWPERFPQVYRCEHPMMVVDVAVVQEE